MRSRGCPGNTVNRASDKRPAANRECQSSTGTRERGEHVLEPDASIERPARSQPGDQALGEHELGKLVELVGPGGGRQPDSR